MNIGLIPRVRVNYSLGDLIEGFLRSERKVDARSELYEIISKCFGTKNVLLTSSGRAGIYMVLRALPQKKVVVPAYTCMVVVEAAMLAGKEIVYASTSKKTFNTRSLPELDSDTIVIATHQYGLPCDIEAIVKQCKESGAVLLEDCAAALGTKINGKYAGTFGDFAIFSFDSSKLVTVPSKGGFILAKDENMLQRIVDATPLLPNTAKYKIKHLVRGLIYWFLKNKWIYRLFHTMTIGKKMQLADHSEPDLSLGEFYTHGFYEWQAVIALSQFKKLDDIIAKRQKVYAYYDEQIHNSKLLKPQHFKDAACIRYAIQVENKEDEYHKCLSKGVDMGFSFNHVACPDNWKEEHVIAREVLNLPYYYDISDREMARVVTVINEL